MTSSRDVVLARIRSALAGDGPPPAIPRDYTRLGSHRPGSEQLIELLTDRLVDYKANVRRIGAADLPAAVEAALTGPAGVVVAPTVGAEIPLEMLVAHGSAKLAKFKLPKHIAVVGELPRNVTLKIARDQLRAEYAPHYGAVHLADNTPSDD